MIHRPFQPDKGRIPLEPLLYLAFLYFQIWGENMGHFTGTSVDHSRIGIQRLCHFADSQYPAIPVQNRTARRLNFPAFFRLGVGPAGQAGSLHDLQPEQPAKNDGTYSKHDDDACSNTPFHELLSFFILCIH